MLVQGGQQLGALRPIFWVLAIRRNRPIDDFQCFLEILVVCGQNSQQKIRLAMMRSRPVGEPPR